MPGYLLGIDIGSSFIKAALVDIDSKRTIASAQSPNAEMEIISKQQGWAEQEPLMWWENVKAAVRSCMQKAGAKPDSVKTIGLSYQMHGLVVVDQHQNVLRPAIIWCDSRAVSIGQKSFHEIGEDYCLKNFLNSPGNFTASKLKWVQENEPEVFRQIHKAMLPGDLIAMKMTGEIVTTETGLSEGVLWDFEKQEINHRLLEHFQIDSTLLPEAVPVFSPQGHLTETAANELGLSSGIALSYRAGDQPNNAFSLNVMSPGEVAATAGTSGVIYAVTDKNKFDPKSRVNTFIHVNNESTSKRNGVLLCINGAGIQNSWMRKNAGGQNYDEMNRLASQIPIGSDGVTILPFGNGAERVFENKDIGASIHNMNFNRHNQAHLFRAAQEGIAFALRYGFDVLTSMGLNSKVIKAGNANLFLSPVFREAFVNTIGTHLELYNTDGATGAALGAGIGAGIYSSNQEAFESIDCIQVEEPDTAKREGYGEIYLHWKKIVTSTFNK